MAITAPTDNGSIQGDSWHLYVAGTAASTWAAASDASIYANAIAAL